MNIRRSHLLATEHKLAELKTDARVVEGGRDHGYKRRNHTLALSCGRYHRRDEGRDQFQVRIKRCSDCSWLHKRPLSAQLISYLCQSKLIASGERECLTIDERHNLADGAANLAESRGSVVKGRASGSSSLGKALLSLGSSLSSTLAGLL